MPNLDMLNKLGEAMGEVYAACHDRLLVNLARYFKELKPGEEPGGAFKYQAAKLAEMGQVTRESMEIIRDMLGGADPQLAQSLEAAILDAIEEIEPELKKAAEAGLVAGKPMDVSPRMTRAFEMYYRQSADKLNLVNTVMLESTEAAYRRTVSDIVSRMQRAQSVLNISTGRVVTGTESFNQALRIAVGDMVDNGITGFVDHGGHRWRPETYVAMDMRTTFHNASREAFWERNEEYGNDLYLVSQHPGARPLCYPWQCKVISRTDESRDVTDGAGQPVHVYAQSETTYGEPAGLFGINCGHHPELFIPGATMVPEVRQSEEENAKAYAESQKQRKLEREFRKARLDLAVAKAQGADKERIRAEREKVKKADERLERFTEETGRKRRREREYRPVDAKWAEETRKAAGIGQGQVGVEQGYAGIEQGHGENAQERVQSDQVPLENAQEQAQSDQVPLENAQEQAQSAQENPVTNQGEPVVTNEEKALTNEGENGTIQSETWYERNIAGNPEMEQKYQAALVKAKEESRMDGEWKTPERPEELVSYLFDAKHINDERHHGVSREEAEGFVREAIVMVTRNDGRYANYYSLDGGAYLMPRQKRIRTAFPSTQFTPNVIRLLEVIMRELRIQ